MALASTIYPGNPDRNLLVIHGYTGSQDDFTHVVEPLADIATVTTIDLPGHGESPRLDRYDYSVLVDAIEVYVTTELSPPTDVLGHSMGGRVAIDLALRRRVILRSLVLLDTWGDTPDRGAHAVSLRAAFALPYDQIAAALASIERDTGERALIEAVWGRGWAERHYAYNDAHVDERAHIELGRIVFVEDTGVAAAFGDITAPTTVIVGERDEPMLGPSVRLAAGIPDARLVTIEGAYHSPQLSHPEEWQRAVRSHLSTS